MGAKKQEDVKIKKKAKRGNNLSDLLAEKQWEKVKIKGNVISDDFAGYEGLIGLEVLNDYDPTMIKSKQSKKGYTATKERSSRKRKATKGNNDGDDDEDSESESSEDEVQSKQSRKAKLAERHAQKLLKQKEKRQRRKEQRKQKANGEHVNTATAAAGVDNEEYAADRFALLRPPPQSPEQSDNESDEEAAPELVPNTAIDMDNLVGWNGLGVPQPILRALAEKGFKSPTEIQALSLPAAIHGKKDILGAAETGSGKTLAFGIPILAGIMELKAKNARTGIRKVSRNLKEPKVSNQQENHRDHDHELTPPPEELDEFSGASDEEEKSEVDDADEDSLKQNSPLYAVILTPTRELAVQVRDHLIAAAKYTGIKVAAIFGGLSVEKQERVLRKCPEIIVATPGRFWELYQHDNKHISKIDELSFLVIDETDRMVEKGHFEELRSLLKVINADERKKQSRQNFVFSATLTLVHDLPEHMQKRNMGKRPKFTKQTADMKIQNLIDELGISQPKIVDITNSQQTAQTLTECRLICPIDHKDYHLYYFIQRHPGRTIVFCNSIDCVKRLGTLFGLLDCNPLPLHANMIQKQRLKNLERFRDDPLGLLIATDVAARGLDIPNVEHVIHYQVPRTSENYVHRSGRTARANKNGITVMFMEPGEVKSYVKLYKTLDRTEDMPLFPISERYLAAVKERVNLARDLDKEELKMRRTQAELGWMKKNAEEMEMIIDGYNDESNSDGDEDPYVIERRKNRIRVESVRSNLKSLLATPIFPRGFSFKYPTVNGQGSYNELTSSSGNSAVETMKAAIEDMKQAKKMRNKRKRTA